VEAAILNFSLQVCSDSIRIIPIAMIDLENVTLNVGISFLSHLKAEI